MIIVALAVQYVYLQPLSLALYGRCVVLCVCVSRVSWFLYRFRVNTGPTPAMICSKSSPRHLQSVAWGLISLSRGGGKGLHFWLQLDLVFGTPPVNKLGRGWAVLAVNFGQGYDWTDGYVFECLWMPKLGEDRKGQLNIHRWYIW